MVTLGALAPVGTRLSDSSYFPGIVATNVVNDTLFGLPWYVDTRVLFYRKDILARAGYSAMPETWSGWRDAMLAIKRTAGPGQYAIFLPMNEWPPQAILGLQQGSPLINAQGYGVFREPAFARAFDFLMGMYRDGLAAPVSNNEIANLYQEFSRGTFAMYITGPWNLGEFRRRLPAAQQSSWGTAPLPSGTLQVTTPSSTEGVMGVIAEIAISIYGPVVNTAAPILSLFTWFWNKTHSPMRPLPS